MCLIMILKDLNFLVMILLLSNPFLFCQSYFASEIILFFENNEIRIIKNLTHATVKRNRCKHFFLSR